MNWFDAPILAPDAEAHHRAEQRQAELTKPPGSLGRLEALAIRLAALQRSDRPTVDPVGITVFAADHGVAARGVSAFPQAVTTEMVRNFANGGAAISVLARQLGARLSVVDLGTVGDAADLPGVENRRIAPATADFSEAEAMTSEQLADALTAGRDAVGEVALFVGGEMGIGNTTSATALACALLERPAAELVGPGTGLDASGVERKRRIVEQALDLHRPDSGQPLEVLRRLGGFEIAALVGAYLCCGQRGIVALVDGFIASVAALVAVRHRPELLPWLFFSHRSAEPGHATVLEAMGAEPLLDLGMRLGEGSGAAVAVPLLRHACALHNGMATFAEAAVSRE